jgi:PAS domain S-box-containing protein
MLRRTIFLAVTGMLVFIHSSLAVGDVTSSTQKRVLLLYHYGRESPGVVLFDRGVENVIKSASSSSVELYREYLETYRFPGEEHAQLMRNYLKNKYANRKIDVIVIHTDTALDFVMRFRDEILPGTPLVFAVSKKPEPGSEPALSTGIWAGPNIEGTLEVALQIQPETTQVFVVSGTSDNEAVELEAQEQLKPFESRVRLNYLFNRPLDDLVATVKTLPAHSIILYQRQTQGAGGRGVVPREAVVAIAQAASVPVYSSWDVWIGEGIVGGKVVSNEELGSRTARMALEILNGTNPKDIPIERSSMVPMFDWGELQRWSIDEERLPTGSIVLFRQVTFWQQYKWRILGVVALLLFQTSLIAGLLVEGFRRRKVTLGLSESEERYRNVVQTQTELICRYLPDTTLTFVNDAYCRYFNKSKEELIGTRFIERMPEHARKQILSQVKMLLEDTRNRVNEHEAILPDGTTAWQQWTNHAIINGDGQVKELQGIGRDITERKLAEQALQISEQRFAKAFKANPQPMSLTTFAEGRYIDVNESFLQMSGYDRREVIGSTSLELNIFEVPEDREKLVRPLRENGSVRNLEFKFRTKGGAFRILLSSAEVINLSGQQCILVASSDITDRKHLEEERLQAENELSQLTARLFTLQDEERRRIARELHDGTAQNLFAVSIDIDLMRKQAENENTELKSLLDESAELCEQSLQEIRTLSYLLHPPLLDQAGLVSALKWYVEGFSKRTGIEVNLIALEGIGRTTSEIETALFRIVQEGLTNIRRHSQSESASIRLQRDSREITLEIQDRGHGMNVGARGGLTEEMHELGVGIPGMRQRLRQLGGRLDITTDASGTLVTAVIPLIDVPDKWHGAFLLDTKTPN